MKWVIQNNLIHQKTVGQLIHELRVRSIPHTEVQLIPFAHTLDGPVPSIEGPVFVYGSTGLGQVAKEQHWIPGYFDENLDYELMLRQYGSLALNAGAVCTTLASVDQPVDNQFFVRPVLDNKSFAGEVMTWVEFETFRNGILSIADDPGATLGPNDRVVVAPLTEILAEYRFFVIENRIITGSIYKVGNRLFSDRRIPINVWDFANQCVQRWVPNQAFVLDVAATPQGLRVLELNSANSAGFYACDLGAIVDAVNDLCCV